MRIVQITDSHVLAAGALWKRQLDMGAALRRTVAAVNRFSPDLVIHTGDVADGGETEAGVEQYQTALEVLAGLSAPLRILPGNHDDRGKLRAAFPGLEWPSGKFLSFSLDAGGAAGGRLAVIGLDSLIPGQTAGGLCAERLEDLRSRLDEAGEAPVLIFTHHPPCPMDLPFMDGFVYESEAELAEVLRGRPVLRIACGHVHAEVDRHWRGTVVSAMSATGAQIPVDQAPLSTDPKNNPPVWTQDPPRIRIFDWDGAGLSVKTVFGEPTEGPYPFIWD